MFRKNWIVADKKNFIGQTDTCQISCCEIYINLHRKSSTPSGFLQPCFPVFLPPAPRGSDFVLPRFRKRSENL